MDKPLRVHNLDGEPAVQCPRCDEIIQPVRNPIGLDGYDCPECDQVIDSTLLRNYRKALRNREEEEEGNFE